MRLRASGSIAATVISVLAVAATATTNPTTYMSRGGLAATLPSVMAKANIPGLSIAVIEDGEVVWHGVFGIANRSTAEPVTDDTVFEAASLTKPLFAYLVFRLIEQGVLELDRPLVDYVPREYLEKEYIGHAMAREGFDRDRFGRITARMVLSHSTGLPHGEPRDPLPILFEPGTQYKYSADGYFYLQKVIEHLVGAPLAEIMSREVLVPLRMDHSSMIWQNRFADTAAVGHDGFGGTTGEYRKYEQAHAGASLYTTATDYARFVAAVIGDVGLKPTTVREMLAPHIDVQEGVRWSLGFGLESTDGVDAFWQWGDYGIFRNYIKACKSRRSGVVYLTNSHNGLSIARKIISLTLGDERNPALDYLGYPRYDEPAFEMCQAVAAGDVEDIADLFARFASDHPEQFRAMDLSLMAVTLIEGGFTDRAMEFARNISVHFPDSAAAAYVLGDACRASGQDDAARKQYRRSLEIISADPDLTVGARQYIATNAPLRLQELEPSR